MDSIQLRYGEVRSHVFAPEGTQTVRGVRTLVAILACIVPALSLAAQNRAVDVSRFAIAMRSANVGLEKWCHGHVVSTDVSQLDAVTFTIADPQGEALEFTFSLPNTTRIWVHGFDLDSAGTLVFSGMTYSSEGRLAPFIAIKGNADKTATLIGTFPYFPYAISVAPDGSIWTVGGETINGRTSGPGIDPNAGVLRHFDRSGRLIGSALPQSALKATGRIVDGFLVATATKVGWYSSTTGPGVYVEMTPDLKTQNAYAGMPGPAGSGQVLGFVLTESGEAYLTWNVPKLSRTTYQLDRSANRWVDVNIPHLENNFAPVLRGDENGALVFRSGGYFHLVTIVGQ